MTPEVNSSAFCKRADKDTVPHLDLSLRGSLGMRLEGITKDREWLYDHYVDAKLFAITKPEWDQKRSS